MFEESYNFGGDGAGGFINSGSQFQNQGSAKKSFAKRERAENLIPVTVRQITECEGEKIKIHDLEADMVTLVGVIKSSNIVSTKVTYEFEDHTGTCEVNQFVETEADKQHSSSQVVDGNYYRVIGSLRNQGGKNFILAFRVNAIKDPNEITSHLLELVFSHVKVPQIAAKAPQAQVNAPSSTLPNSFMNPATGLSNSMSSGANNLGMTTQQLLVYNVIRNATIEDKPEGVGRSEMQNALRGKLNANEINNIVDFLSQEGHIYSTIDENHFKSTDA